MDQSGDHSAVQDRIELKELRYDYCEHLDAKVWDEWLALFTEDITFDASGVPGMERLEGKEELREFIDDYLDTSSEYATHHAFHPRIDIDGDEATGKWVLDEIAVTPDGTVWWMQGSYLDEYRRVDGDWRFSTVAVTIDAQAELDGFNIQYPS